MDPLGMGLGTRSKTMIDYDAIEQIPQIPDDVLAEIDSYLDSDIGLRHRRSAASIVMHNDDNYRSRYIEGTKKRSESKEWKKNTIEAINKRTQSEQWREANKIASIKRSKNPEWIKKQVIIQKNAIEKRMTPAILVDTGKFYISTQEASDVTGIGRKSITAALNGYNKTAGGSRWRFATPEEVEAYKNTQPQG
jgi:hypothetical protein